MATPYARRGGRVVVVMRTLGVVDFELLGFFELLDLLDLFDLFGLLVGGRVGATGRWVGGLRGRRGWLRSLVHECLRGERR